METYWESSGGDSHQAVLAAFAAGAAVNGADFGATTGPDRLAAVRAVLAARAGLAAAV